MKHGYKKCPRCGIKLAEESKLDEKYITAGVIMIFLLVAALIVMLLSCYFVVKIKEENKDLLEKQASHSTAIEALQDRLETSRELYYKELLHDINYIVSSHNANSDLEYELKNLLQCNRLLVAFNKDCRLVSMVERYILLSALIHADKKLKVVKLTEKDYQGLSPEFVEKCTGCRNGIKLCTACKGINSCPECEVIKKCTECSASGFIVHTKRAERALRNVRRRIRKFVTEANSQ